MSTTSTPNYGLVKPTPDTGEPADVAVVNGNMDLIDSAIDAVQTDIDATNTSLTATNADVDAAQADITALQTGNPDPIYKSASTLCTNDATLNNDPDFHFEAEAGKTYYGSLELAILASGSDTGDFKCGFNFPAGRMTMFVRGPDLTFTHGDVIDLLLSKMYYDIDANTSYAHIGVSPYAVWTEVKFVYRCDVAGTVNFKWCQNEPTSDGTSVARGSHMIYRSVDTP